MIECTIVAVSFAASASWAAETVTVRAWSQVASVKVSAALSVTSVSPVARDGVTVTSPDGCEVSTTV